MAKYQFSKLAERDLEDIADYTVMNFGVFKTREYKALLIQSAKTAANFPSIGRPYTTEHGRIFQRFNVGRHVLFYQPTEQGIFIVRVLHLMMDFDQYLD
ncbi:hypothetical protein MNBD_ALPHA12-521 [hydrothermal vent metagenome]|uniref:Toxin n=1 Tax=hydrothermal vent metagenome TaxID=652676 RepID=A0A3B0TRI5_9ZZZZ